MEIKIGKTEEVFKPVKLIIRLDTEEELKDIIEMCRAPHEISALVKKEWNPSGEKHIMELLQHMRTELSRLI